MYDEEHDDTFDDCDGCAYSRWVIGQGRARCVCPHRKEGDDLTEPCPYWMDERR
jgi:hypothetical protein|tara:strand:- start:152 stop:313 length:162 start_codon:yes stop_codon:yes gene_type:complete